MPTYFLVEVHEILGTNEREHVKNDLKSIFFTRTDVHIINKDLSRTTEEIINPQVYATHSNNISNTFTAMDGRSIRIGEEGRQAQWPRTFDHTIPDCSCCLCSGCHDHEREDEHSDRNG